MRDWLSRFMGLPVTRTASGGGWGGSMWQGGGPCQGRGSRLTLASPLMDFSTAGASLALTWRVETRLSKTVRKIIGRSCLSSQIKLIDFVVESNDVLFLINCFRCVNFNLVRSTLYFTNFFHDFSRILSLYNYVYYFLVYAL